MLILAKKYKYIMTNRDFYREHNSSFKSPNRFRVVIARFPDVELYTQSFPLPSFNIGTNERPTNKYTSYHIPSETMHFDDLVLDIMVDEELVNWKLFFKWMKDMTSSEKLEDRWSQISLHLLTNNNNLQDKIVFKHAFPYNVSQITNDTQTPETDYLKFSVSFKYSEMDIVDDNG